LEVLKTVMFCIVRSPKLTLMSIVANAILLFYIVKRDMSSRNNHFFQFWGTEL